jgi:hypothetical protein
MLETAVCAVVATQEPKEARRRRAQSEEDWLEEERYVINIQASEPVVEMQTRIGRKWRPEGRRRRHGRWRQTSTWPLAGGDQASTTDLTMTPGV